MTFKAYHIANKLLFEEYSIIEDIWVKIKDNIHETFKLILEAISWPKRYEIIHAYMNSNEYIGKWLIWLYYNRKRKE